MGSFPSFCDPDLFELHCPGCGYAISNLVRECRACPECGQPIPSDWRQIDQHEQRAERARRRCFSLFLCAGCVWVPIAWGVWMHNPATATPIAIMGFLLQILLGLEASRGADRAGAARLLTIARVLVGSFVYSASVWAIATLVGSMLFSL